ncbi:uncharacterized protein TRUGW13939_10381 [Talaromyces rugulosus]|uniref:Uncharacterized protein n=1 Tax=Talaromyces rugulosus TaxID=121627 RepID=A0A7H8RA13_TALRU|nr:uncharacterized protein TRUGW13939_10381 [Talaromyces rugulosus]QKX63212.1 hypothetical protein TRUGW13939_10381 [Talaromyces rugulosus]
MAAEIRPYTKRLYSCTGYLPLTADSEQKLIKQQLIDDSSDEEHLSLPVTRKRSYCRSGASVVGIVSVVLLEMVAFAVLVTDSRSGKVPDSRPPQAQGGSVVTAHCGTTPEGAKARGCFWDIMSFGWMHPSCFDREESARWEAEYGPWEWYSERPGNETDLVPLTAEELPYSPVVWKTQGYHVQHCLLR